jgi:hypothetical protein
LNSTAVAGKDPPSEATEHQIRFFDFARHRTYVIGTLAGVLEDWVGGLTVSPDSRTIVYSQRTYRTREIMLVENFR